MNISIKQSCMRSFDEKKYQISNSPNDSNQRIIQNQDCCMITSWYSSSHSPKPQQGIPWFPVPTAPTPLL